MSGETQHPPAGDPAELRGGGPVCGHLNRETIEGSRLLSHTCIDCGKRWDSTPPGARRFDYGSHRPGCAIEHTADMPCVRWVPGSGHGRFEEIP